VQILLAFRPFAAEIWFRRPPIGASPVVERAADAVVVQITARGDYFGLDREIAGPLHLAEIRRPAGSHQGLQFALPFGAHDLDLEVPAAGCSPLVVRRPAGRQRAGITAAQHRKVSGRRRQPAHGRAAVFHDHKPVPAQSPGLVRVARASGSGSPVTVGGAFSFRAVAAQIPAGDMKHGVDVQLSLILPQIVERNSLGVADQPRRFVVK
jgi:hypothetical protein